MMWPEDEKISFTKNPDLLLSMKYAVRSAAYFWVKNKLYGLADDGINQVASNNITEVVNKATDSYQDRFNNSLRIKELMVFE